MKRLLKFIDIKFSWFAILFIVGLFFVLNGIYNNKTKELENKYQMEISDLQRTLLIKQAYINNLQK